MVQRTQGFRQVRAARCVILLLLCTVEGGDESGRLFPMRHMPGRGCVTRVVESSIGPAAAQTLLPHRLHCRGSSVCVWSCLVPHRLGFGGDGISPPLQERAGAGVFNRRVHGGKRRGGQRGGRWGLSLRVPAADARSARGGAAAGWSALPAGSGAAEQPPRGAPGSLLHLHSGELDLGFSGG